MSMHFALSVCFDNAMSVCFDDVRAPGMQSTYCLFEQSEVIRTIVPFITSHSSLSRASAHGRCSKTLPRSGSLRQVSIFLRRLARHRRCFVPFQVPLPYFAANFAYAWLCNRAFIPADAGNTIKLSNELWYFDGDNYASMQNGYTYAYKLRTSFQGIWVTLYNASSPFISVLTWR